jgi:hypothetical protein
MLVAGNVGGRKCRRPDSYSYSYCLLLSPAEDLSQKVLPLLHAVPKWNLLTDPLSLYGRRLCHTGTACCTSTTCQNVRALQMSAAADILTLFSEKNQKPNSAHKCPITSIQVFAESQKLSEFICITFGSLNRGRPPFQPLFLKITNFCPWEQRVGGQAGYTRPAFLSRVGEGEARTTVLVLHILEMHVDLFLLSPFC